MIGDKGELKLWYSHCLVAKQETDLNDKVGISLNFQQTTWTKNSKALFFLTKLPYPCLWNSASSQCITNRYDIDRYTNKIWYLKRGSQIYDLRFSNSSKQLDAGALQQTLLLFLSCEIIHNWCYIKHLCKWDSVYNWLQINYSAHSYVMKENIIRCNNMFLFSFTTIELCNKRISSRQ